MFKPQRGIILVVTLVFLLLTGLVFNNLSEQVLQGNKLLFGLQSQVEQVLAYRSARSNLASQLESLPLVQLLSDLSQATQDKKGEGLIHDFSSLLRCSEDLNLQWSRLAITNTSDQFYLNLLSYTKDAKGSANFIFVVLTCLANQLDFNEVTLLEIYQLDSSNKLTSLFFAITTTARSNF